MDDCPPLRCVLPSAKLCSNSSSVSSDRCSLSIADPNSLVLDMVMLFFRRRLLRPLEPWDQASTSIVLRRYRENFVKKSLEKNIVDFVKKVKLSFFYLSLATVDESLMPCSQDTS